MSIWFVTDQTFCFGDNVSLDCSTDHLSDWTLIIVMIDN